MRIFPAFSFFSIALATCVQAHNLDPDTRASIQQAVSDALQDPKVLSSIFENNPEILKKGLEKVQEYEMKKAEEAARKRQERMQEKAHHLSKAPFKTPCIKGKEKGQTRVQDASTIAFVMPECGHCRQLIQEVSDIHTQDDTQNLKDTGLVVVCDKDSPQYWWARALLAALNMKQAPQLVKTLVTSNVNSEKELKKLFEDQEDLWNEFQAVVNEPWIDQELQAMRDMAKDWGMEAFPVVLNKEEKGWKAREGRPPRPELEKLLNAAAQSLDAAAKSAPQGQDS